MFGVSVRRTSAGFSRPGRRWSRSAWPTDSWIASGAASTSVSMAASMSSIPARKPASPGMPWSTATSKQRPECGWNSRFSRYCFTVLLDARRSPARAGRRERTGDGMPTGVLIAGPNLTLDRTAALAELRPGEVLRLERVVVTAGGKGLNVARAARALGVRALLVGFVPGATGRAGAAMIEREGVALRAIPCGGELRSTSVVIERGGRTTVLNEPGPQVSDAEWAAFEDAVADALHEHAVLVCSGSVPPGSPEDAYARLTALAAGADRRCIVDAAGATLAAALAARPDVACPNL